MLLQLFTLVAAVVGVVYLYIKKAFSYWEKKGVPSPEITVFRSLRDSFLAKRTLGESLQSYYMAQKQQGHKYTGIYFLTKPFYMPIDPKMIKSVLVKDFQNFHSRGFYYNEKYDPLSAHLFSLDGEKWKNLRAKLSPTFTSGKLKKMFQTLVDCSTELATCLNEPISKDEPIDIKTICQKYTIDVIGSCAFGIECNSFKQPDTEFRRVGTKAFKLPFAQRMKFFLVVFWPRAGTLFRIRITDLEVQNFFMSLVKDTVEYREKNNIIRNDFLQLLIELKNKGLEAEDLPDDMKHQAGVTLNMNETAAQAFIFFLAGFETSSTTMTFCLYELAKHEEIQEKLRREVVDVLKKHDGKITYEAISEMRYLDQVISEALRKYPPVSFLRRKTMNNYQIPDTNITVDKNVIVMIPVLALHRDPEYYPNPDVFDPDRFTNENKAKRPDFTYLPFGDGPRNCIGLRFGLLQAKVGMCQLIMNYKFKINPKTIEPLEFDPKAGIFSTKQTIYLSASRVTD